MTFSVSSPHCPFGSWHMDIDIPYSSTLPNDAIRIFSFTTSSLFMWKPYMSSAVQSLGYFLDFHMLDATNFWVQESDLCRGANFLITDMLQWCQGIWLPVTSTFFTLISKYHIDKALLEWTDRTQDHLFRHRSILLQHFPGRILSFLSIWMYLISIVHV